MSDPERDEKELVHRAVFDLGELVSNLKAALEELLPDHILWQEFSRQNIMEFLRAYAEMAIVIIRNEWTMHENYQHIQQWITEERKAAVATLKLLGEHEMTGPEMKSMIKDFRNTWKSILPTPRESTGSTESSESSELSDEATTSDENQPPVNGINGNH